MRYFCTFFDHRYLPKGLALYQSLILHCSHPFQLSILCLDRPCHQTLSQLNLPFIQLIELSELEQADPALLRTKTERTLAEYYFTCKACLPAYLFEQQSHIDFLTYLDADLFFFSSLDPIYQATADYSVAITGHRFSPANQSLEVFGLYNAGWMAFRRDTQGLACLRWWRERCIEWCYDRVEGQRFADQKYINLWPALFQGVLALPHKGTNLAPWNIDNYQITRRDNQLWVDEQPLIFYHFTSLKEDENGQLSIHLSAQQFIQGQLKPALHWMFEHYIHTLKQTKQLIAPLLPQVSLSYSVRGQPIPAHTAQPEFHVSALNNPQPAPPTISKSPTQQPSPNPSIQQSSPHQNRTGLETLIAQMEATLLPHPPQNSTQKNPNSPIPQTPQLTSLATNNPRRQVSLLIVQPEIIDLINQQHTVEALQSLETQIRSQPTHAAAHNDLGILSFQIPTAREKALQHLQQAAHLQPQQLVFQRNLAYGYRMLKRLNEALQIFSKLAAQQPQQVEWLINCAELCQALAQPEQAQDFWQKAAQLDPKIKAT